MRMLPFPWLLALSLVTILADGVQAVDPPYSMPAADAMYPAPPWTYRDCNMLQISFRSDPDVVARMVPAPLVPNPDGVMFVWLADMKVVELFKLSYLEHGLAVHPNSTASRCCTARTCTSMTTRRLPPAARSGDGPRNMPR